MKIGIDIRTFMDANFSGIPEYTHNLLKEIFKLDKKNQYILFYNSFGDFSCRIPGFKADNVKIVHTAYPNKIFNNILQRILYWPKIDRLFNVDLFFVPNIAYIALSNKTRSLLTIHDLSFVRFPEFYSPKRQIWHRVMNIKKMAKRFETIVAVSEHTKKDIIELCGIEPERVKVIYSGVGAKYRPLAPGNTDCERVKKHYDLPEKFILCLSTIEPRKNISGLIKAYGLMRQEYPELKDYQLILAGVKGWRYKETLRAWHDSKYKEDIRFIDYVHSNDKPAIYNLASLFVYPSFYEGFGFPLLEAMASATPVITGTVSSLPEVAGGSALLINPENAREIADAMAAVLSDVKLQEEMISGGVKQSGKFSWETSAKAYMSLFFN
ncbi:glycosyltransferase family 4 protein [Candidatus Parcubacteria bacterium]|nr:glycosyltransferase family 4 protein [Candidatus Parcubacteria bacterium]